ncbi:MAG TPA: 1-deoxy-D-xylulose-5-phosphate synthase [Nitrospirota bacterium]|nr:1-deoxy-D-xylulose-5-phosphate synthase [Nitrospirota bacterium]
MIPESITSPADIKELSIHELKELSARLRQTVIDRVSQNGGHLASNLGVVELTVSLHYVFNSPTDKIIWDVGHQSYCHKLLTGRSGRFSTLRKKGGLSGFPRRDESAHDVFGTGHSSTSISAALGILEGRNMNGDHGKVIVVIGDGAMTSGLAFEGLNNAGQRKKDMIVILNDNAMSISPNVGALSSYLNRIITGKFYQRFKQETKTFLDGLPKIGEHAAKAAHRMEEMLKGLFLPGILFEELGFNYVGPVDGHDIQKLIVTLEGIKNAASPTLIHVITKKGKGYRFSEENPSAYHGVGPFDPETGRSAPEAGMTFGEAFGNALTKCAAGDDSIVAISAAMKEGTGLERFAEKYPGRFYDVGIAEPHAVTLAAGLATQGLKPVVAIYSTFLQRAYDQIVHDVCLQNLHVVFAIDRAGMVGEDGPTHNGLFDLSYLRHIPNLVVMAPKDDVELVAMLGLALKHNGPAAIRYPRGKVKRLSGRPSGNGGSPGSFNIGEAELLRNGSDVALIALGHTVLPALSAATLLEAEGISAAVVNARFVKPLDAQLICSVAAETKRVVTVEENVLAGGFGSAVLELLHDREIEGVHVKRCGISDTFVEQGRQDELRKKHLLDQEGIYQTALSILKERKYTFSK